MWTRRDILKSALFAGGALQLSTNGPQGRSFAASPATIPFVDNLLDGIPPEPTADAVFPALGQIDPACEYFVNRAQGAARFFRLAAVQGSYQFHRDLPPTQGLWHYQPADATSWNFAFGPTFRVRQAADRFSGTFMRLENRLNPAQVTGFGIPELTTHYHGMHGPARSDGFPFDVPGIGFKPVVRFGEYFDYAWPMLDPGYLTGDRDTTARPAMQWYHDHLLDFTAQNVYRGLVGLYLVFDELDTGNETLGLRLPSGNYDIPLVLQDKLFGPKGELIYDSFSHNGFLGDKFLVTGKIQPFLNVDRRRYRFRFLNGSNARMFAIFLTDENGRHYPMTQIASEGGLLSHAISRDYSLISGAERFEIVVDLADPIFNGATKLYFEDRLVQDDGRGPRGTREQPELVSNGTRLVQLRLGGRVADNSLPVPIGRSLRPFNPIDATTLGRATRRSFKFDRSHGAWTINGQLAGRLDQSLARPAINGPEIWTIENSSGGWWHPIHIHSDFHRLLRRNGGTPPEWERDGVAKKDTTLLGPNDKADIFLDFRDYHGPFVFHCHNIEHEDMAMMGRFDIRPGAGSV